MAIRWAICGNRASSKGLIRYDRIGFFSGRAFRRSRAARAYAPISTSKIDMQIHRFFKGKHDLEKQLVRKLRGYRVPAAKFIVMRDKDVYFKGMHVCI